MPAKFGIKNCLECQQTIELSIRRDIERKKFCSRSCLGSYCEKQRSEDKKIKNFTHLADNSKKGRKGNLHHNYKQDRSQIQSPRPRYELTKWSQEVFKRDDYTCQHCEQRGGKLQADHIKPYKTHPELRWDLSNGQILCIDCHKKTDTYGIKLVHKLKREGFYPSQK